jgi:hypothetical protein
VWLALFVASPLPYPDLTQRCHALVREVDRLLAEIDL